MCFLETLHTIIGEVSCLKCMFLTLGCPLVGAVVFPVTDDKTMQKKTPYIESLLGWSSIIL